MVYLLFSIILHSLCDIIKLIYLRGILFAAADLAVVNAAVCLTLSDDDTCRNVRIALGSVAPTPMRAKEAEAMLEGKQANNGLLKKVADQASKEIKPISDVRASAEYRTILSRVLVERALQRVTTALEH